MYNKKHFEVLVAGAGPVGMTTALLLARKGIKTAIIDRETGTARRSYACALHPSSIETLYDAGLGEELAAEGHRIESMSFYEEGLRQAGVDFSALNARHPHVLVLPQSRLEALLAEKLSECPEATLLWNHRLSDLAFDGISVTAKVDRLTKSAQGYAVPEVEWETAATVDLTAKYVIGADGCRSHVRRCLGIEYERVGEPQRFAVFELESTGSTGTEMKVVLHEQTSSVMWPFGDSRCRWGFQLNRPEPVTEEREKERDGLDFIEASSDDDSLHRLRHFLVERVPWFDQPVRQVDWSAEIQFEQRLAKSFVRDRCWLIGDAAHQIGPIGMKSMNIGISEGADLANRLAGVFHGRLEMAPLLSYESMHRPEWRKLLGLEPSGLDGANAPDWVARHAEVIPAMIPASGDHLQQLLEQLKLATKI